MTCKNNSLFLLSYECPDMMAIWMCSLYIHITSNEHIMADTMIHYIWYAFYVLSVLICAESPERTKEWTEWTTSWRNGKVGEICWETILRCCYDVAWSNTHWQQKPVPSKSPLIPPTPTRDGQMVRTVMVGWSSYWIPDSYITTTGGLLNTVKLSQYSIM